MFFFCSGKDFNMFRLKFNFSRFDFDFFLNSDNCSDFRYESNGIFVLGVGFFFLQTHFDFLTSYF